MQEDVRSVVPRITAGSSRTVGYKEADEVVVWEQSRGERFPKTLFAFSQCRIAKTTVPETCSLSRWCTPTIGLESWRRQHNNEKRQNLTHIDHLRDTLTWGLPVW
jgi:hypothetical protein